MNDQQLEQLLERRKGPPGQNGDYSPDDAFIAAFHHAAQRRQRQRTAVRLAAIAACISLLLGGLCWRNRQPSAPGDASPADPSATAAAPVGLDYLAETQRQFGADIGALFVNDDLVLFERQELLSRAYRIRIQILSPSSHPLATLEFIAGRNDFINLDAAQIAGTIFLSTCNEHGTIIELALRVQGQQRQAVVIDDIFAFDSRQKNTAQSNDVIIKVDFTPEMS
ncbi:MAG: hypothetical protein PHT80_11580 [Lentisphaeria bacterium]|nr:hypothetical protein [Lentisphaeria bacterium]